MSRPRRAVLTCAGLAVLSLLNWWQIRTTGIAGNPTASLTLPAHAEDGTTEHCDLLVVGGTPSGVAAALAAARRGLKVVMIEERTGLGGDTYYAMLNMFDVPMKPGQASPVVYGIFAEFFEQLGMSFSIDKAKRLFEEAVAAEPNIHLYKGTRVVRVITENNRVKGIVTSQVPPPVSTKAQVVPGKAPVVPKPTLKPTATSQLPASVEEIAAIATPAAATALATATPAAKPAVPAVPVERTIVPKIVIDATNDADIAARAGAVYYRGREHANPDKKMQSAGLLFSVSGVDWRAVRRYVRGRRPATLVKVPSGKPTYHTMDLDIANRAAAERLKRRPVKVLPGKRPEPTSLDLKPATRLETPVYEDEIKNSKTPLYVGLGGQYGDYIWERGDIVKDYKERGPNIIALSINFGRQPDGTVILNTINIINVNGLSPTSIKKGRDEAIKELPHFIAHLRKRMPGFKNAKLAKVAPELYIRETRHIHGFYTLAVKDVIGQRKFDDRVALVSYPLDLHPYAKNEHNVFGPKRYFYTLPFKSLVPHGVENMMVASRSISATYSAAGSARVIPITMAGGEAAGTAAWLCLKNNITPHDMAGKNLQIKELRQALLQWGVDVGDHCPRPAP